MIPTNVYLVNADELMSSRTAAAGWGCPAGEAAARGTGCLAPRARGAGGSLDLEVPKFSSFSKRVEDGLS